MQLKHKRGSLQVTYAPAEAAGGPTCLPKYLSWQEGVSPRLSSRHSISLFNGALGLGSDRILLYFSLVCLRPYTFALAASYENNYPMSKAALRVSQIVILKPSTCSVTSVLALQFWVQRAYMRHVRRQKFQKAFRKSRGKRGKVWWVAQSKALKSALVGTDSYEDIIFFFCAHERSKTARLLEPALARG